MAFMHPEKSGTRILGIAESFRGRDRSILAGIVMRRDLRIDGAALETITVGGMDATEAIIRIYETLNRSDINLILISGAVMAWYNIISPDIISQTTDRPVIIITYEQSDGLCDTLRYHFPGDSERLAAYKALGERDFVRLHTGHTVYLRRAGIPLTTAEEIIHQITLDGKVPEPVRVARLIARSVMRSSQTGI